MPSSTSKSAPQRLSAQHLKAERARLIELSVEQREAKRARWIEKNPELVRVSDALEHIVVTGAKVRRDRLRRLQFEENEQQQQQQQQYTEGATPGANRPMDCPPMQAHLGVEYMQKRRKRKHTPATEVFHAEDLRIYGRQYHNHFPNGFLEGCNNNNSNNNSNNNTTHTTTSESIVDDSEWDLEHGDSIPPILFRMAKLSQEDPSDDNGHLARFNDPNAVYNKSLTSTNITPDDILKDVPRALIEKCWEKAVHLASTTLVVPVETDPAREGATPNPSDEPLRIDSTSTNTKPFRQEECIQKCETLGIDIEALRTKLLASETEQAAKEAAKPKVRTFQPNDKSSASTEASANTDTANTICPRCTRVFETERELLDHFYGTTEPGCCKALMRPQHLNLIRTILQNYVRSQSDQLWKVFLSQQAAPTESNSNDGTHGKKTKTKKRKQTFNEEEQPQDWRDVRRCMETAVNESQEIPDGAGRTAARHPVQESLLIRTETASQEGTETGSSDDVPLILNPMILEAARRRLIDRYADLPP